MKKLILSLFLSLALGTALALEFPSQAELVVVSETGTIVGVGKIANGTLALELVTGSDGFAKLLVVDAAGTLQTVEVMVNADGTVTLVLGNGFVSLASLAADAGITSSTAVDAELPQTPLQVLAELPEEAKAGIAGAEQHRADAAARAADARAKADADVEVEGEVEGDASDATGLDQAAGVANENAAAGLDTAQGAVAGNPPVNEETDVDEIEADEEEQEVEAPVEESETGTVPETGRPSTPTPPVVPAPGRP